MTVVLIKNESLIDTSKILKIRRRNLFLFVLDMLGMAVEKKVAERVAEKVAERVA